MADAVPLTADGTRSTAGALDGNLEISMQSVAERTARTPYASTFNPQQIPRNEIAHGSPWEAMGRASQDDVLRIAASQKRSQVDMPPGWAAHEKLGWHHSTYAGHWRAELAPTEDQLMQDTRVIILPSTNKVRALTWVGPSLTDALAAIRNAVLSEDARWVAFTPGRTTGHSLIVDKGSRRVYSGRVAMSVLTDGYQKLERLITQPELSAEIQDQAARWCQAIQGMLASL